MTDRTPVIFRKFKNDDVIALFPFDPSDSQGWNCCSYMHVGQHGGASPFIVGETNLATPEEYFDLSIELMELGYNCVVYQRFPNNSYQIRKSIINQIT